MCLVGCLSPLSLRQCDAFTSHIVMFILYLLCIFATQDDSLSRADVPEHFNGSVDLIFAVKYDKVLFSVGGGGQSLRE